MPVLNKIYAALEAYQSQQKIIKNFMILKKNNDHYLLSFDLSLVDKRKNLPGHPPTDVMLIEEIQQFIESNIAIKTKFSVKKILVPYSNIPQASYFQAEYFTIVMRRIMPDNFLNIKESDDIINQQAINLKNKIYDMIVQSHPDGISQSDLTLKTRELNKDTRKNVLNDLIYCDMIYIDEDRSKGRIKNIFKVKL